MSSPAATSSPSTSPPRRGRTQTALIAGFDATDIFNHMIEDQNKNRTFNDKAEYLKFRRLLVDWMAEVSHKKFRLQPHTTHVAVMYLDRILQSSIVERDRLQLVSMVAILIAAKFEERELDVPPIVEIVQELGNQFSAKHVCEMEILVLNRLKWDLSEYTALHFLAHFFHNGVLYEDDMIHQTQTSAVSLKKITRYLQRYAEFFAEMTLQEYGFQKYSSSIVAASIVVASRKAINIMPYWRPEMEPLLRCKWDDIRECLEDVLNLYDVQIKQVYPSPDNVSGVDSME